MCLNNVYIAKLIPIYFFYLYLHKYNLVKSDLHFNRQNYLPKMLLLCEQEDIRGNLRLMPLKVIVEWKHIFILNLSKYCQTEL